MVAALAVAAFLGGGQAIATAGAKSGPDAGTCPGAYVIAVDAASRQQASDALLCLVNQERTSRGLPAVRPAAALARAAAAHSADMVAHRYFSHIDGSGDSVQQRADRAGYRWMAIGETLDWGAGKRTMPVRVVAALLSSAEHRPIVLDRRYDEIGVGLVAGAPQRNARGPAATLTLVFGKR